MGKILRFLLLLACSSLVSACACGQDLVAVEGRPYREIIDLPGATVAGYQVTEIRAKLGGYVKSLGEASGQVIDIGSQVSGGTVLAELDVPEMQDAVAEQTAKVEQARSQVAQAEAAVAEAEANVVHKQAELKQVRSRTAQKHALLQLSQTRLKRLTGLAGSGTIGQDNLDEASFEVEAAQAALASTQADVQAASSNVEAARAGVRRANADKLSAEAHVKVAQATLKRLQTTLDYSVIRAPYDGIITRRWVDLGSFVQPADNNSAAAPLFEITQIDRVRLVAAVPNNHVAKVQVGQPAVFRSIGGLDGRQFAGQITRLAGALDPDTRTMRIEVHLDNPATDTLTDEAVELKPGLYGTLSVVLNEWSDDDLLPVVPTTAVGRDDSGNHFVMLLQDGRPVRQRVRVTFNDAAAVGISQGLNVGDKVLRTGGTR